MRRGAQLLQGTLELLVLKAVSWGPRIGIAVGVDRPWRCWVTGHRSVSGGRSRA